MYDHTLHQNLCPQAPPPVFVPLLGFLSPGNPLSTTFSITFVTLSLSEVDNVLFPSEVGQEVKCLD